MYRKVLPETQDPQAVSGNLMFLHRSTKHQLTPVRANTGKTAKDSKRQQKMSKDITLSKI